MPLRVLMCALRGHPVGTVRYIVLAFAFVVLMPAESAAQEWKPGCRATNEWQIRAGDILRIGESLFPVFGMVHRPGGGPIPDEPAFDNVNCPAPLGDEEKGLEAQYLLRKYPGYWDFHASALRMRGKIRPGISGTNLKAEPYDVPVLSNHCVVPGDESTRRVSYSAFWTYLKPGRHWEIRLQSSRTSGEACEIILTWPRESAAGYKKTRQYLEDSVNVCFDDATDRLHDCGALAEESKLRALEWHSFTARIHPGTSANAITWTFAMINRDSREGHNVKLVVCTGCTKEDVIRGEGKWTEGTQRIYPGGTNYYERQFTDQEARVSTIWIGAAPVADRGVFGGGCETRPNDAMNTMELACQTGPDTGIKFSGWVYGRQIHSSFDPGGRCWADPRFC